MPCCLLVAPALRWPRHSRPPRLPFWCPTSWSSRLETRPRYPTKIVLPPTIQTTATMTTYRSSTPIDTTMLLSLQEMPLLHYHHRRHLRYLKSYHRPQIHRKILWRLHRSKIHLLLQQPRVSRSRFRCFLEKWSFKWYFLGATTSTNDRTRAHSLRQSGRRRVDTTKDRHHLGHGDWRALRDQPSSAPSIEFLAVRISNQRIEHQSPQHHGLHSLHSARLSLR